MATVIRGSDNFDSADAGKVLQVKQTHHTSDFSTSSTSMVDITGLNVSITPVSTSNKVLVSCVINFATSATYLIAFNLLRGTTPIGIGTLGAGGPNYTASMGGVGTAGTTVVINFLDSPASTTAQIYKVQLRMQAGAGTVYINRNADLNTTSDVYGGAMSSTITAMEIAG